MERKMEPIEAGIKDRLIALTQSDPLEETPLTIYIHPAQVDLVIQWLKELKTELEKKLLTGRPSSLEETQQPGH